MSRGERVADRYELCTPIGHGAMGEVRECTDLRLKRQVAPMTAPASEPSASRSSVRIPNSARRRRF